MCMVCSITPIRVHSLSLSLSRSLALSLSLSRSRVDDQLLWSTFAVYYVVRVRTPIIDMTPSPTFAFK